MDTGGFDNTMHSNSSTPDSNHHSNRFPVMQAASVSDETGASTPDPAPTTPEDDEVIHEQRQRRSLLLHYLYAADSYEYDISLESLIDGFKRGFEVDTDPDLAVMTQAIIDERASLDEFLKPLFANWRPERIGLCTRLILRMALWELLHTDIAPSIIINEAIELSKCFSEKDAYKFVNGVLDEALKRLGKKVEAGSL